VPRHLRPGWVSVHPKMAATYIHVDSVRPERGAHLNDGPLVMRDAPNGTCLGRHHVKHRPCGATPGSRNVRSVIPRLTTTLLSLVAVVAVAAPGYGAPRDVVRDYFADGHINGAYSVEDLRGALIFAERRTGSGSQYSAFADAVSQAITDDLVGSGAAAAEQLKAQRKNTELSPAPAPAESPPSNGGLPTPPSSAPGDSLPTAVPIMGLVAVVLVLAGIGSSVWRRLRR